MQVSAYFPSSKEQLIIKKELLLFKEPNHSYFLDNIVNRLKYIVTQKKESQPYDVSNCEKTNQN